MKLIILENPPGTARFIGIIGIIAAAIAFAAPALAQDAHIASVFPPGGQRGKVVNVQFSGKKFGKLRQLYFSHPAIKAQSIKGNSAAVSIADNVPYGDYEVWALTDKGLTNPRRFAVGRFAESNESKANEDAASAQKLQLPITINGTLNPGTDRDCYRFDVKGGQPIHCVFRSATLDGTARAALTLIGPDGKELLHDDGRTEEPVLDFQTSEPGSFVLKLEERGFQSGVNNVYRLSIFTGPRLVSAFPHILAKGLPQLVTLYGYQFPPGTTPPKKPIDTGDAQSLVRRLPLQSVPMQLKPPTLGDEDGGGWLDAHAAMIDGFRYHRPDMTGTLRFGLTDGPVTIENDQPHGSMKQAQSIANPCMVAGRFLQRREVDWYRIAVKKGQSLWLETTAERDGHPMDLELAIHDGKGKVLKTASDFAIKGSPIPLDTLDAMCAWKAPADGDYYVVVRDLHGAARSSVDRTYRLSVGKRLEKVCVAAMPSGKTASGFSVSAGGTAKLQLVAVRYNGHQDPIHIRLAKSPPGVKAKELAIPAKSTAATWTLSADADADASPKIGRLEMVAETKIEGKLTVVPVVPLTAVHVGSTQVRRCQGMLIAITEKAAAKPAKKKK